MQTIWITGGSSGIGYATAKAFLDKGWRVIISSSNKDKLDNAEIKLKKINSNYILHSITCDISSKNQVNKTITHIEENIAKIDIFKRNLTEILREELWKHFFEIGVVHQCTRVQIL